MTDITTRAAGIVPDGSDFDKLIEAAMYGLKPSSQRIYRETYAKWVDWCHNAGVPPTDLLPGNVEAFLADHDATRRTKQRWLSALRKLTDVMAIDPDNRRAQTMHALLKRVKVADGTVNRERRKRALKPSEVMSIVEAWPDKGTPIHTRNRALVALLLATGLRRSEAAALQWRDVNLEEGTLLVRSGKGGKARDVVIVGRTAIREMLAWKALSAGYTTVFPPMDNQGRVMRDKPMSGDNIWRIVKQAQALSGVTFSPHDARRTLATELLAQGASVKDVQDQLGHASAATTLVYAQEASVQERRKRLKTRYD